MQRQRLMTPRSGGARLLTTGRRALVSALVRVYGRVNRAGWLDHPVALSLFSRSYFAYKRIVEDPFYALTLRAPALFRGGDVLDVGANIGYTAVVFARALDPGRRVHAFEPESRNYAQLLDNIGRRGLGERVHAEQLALGSAPGRVRLWVNLDHHGDHRVFTDTFAPPGPRDSVSVLMQSVDAYVAEARIESLSFFKLDVQGYELPVLQGADRTLSTHRNLVVAVEHCPSAARELGFDPEAVLALLTRHGFRLHLFSESGRVAPVERSELESLAGDDGYVNLLCARRSVEV
jgi:FkbM family methyltransferase